MKKKEVTQTIYIIEEHVGEYDDYRMTPIKAFTSIVKAEKYVERLENIVDNLNKKADSTNLNDKTLPFMVEGVLWRGGSTFTIDEIKLVL